MSDALEEYELNGIRRGIREGHVHIGLGPQPVPWVVVEAALKGNAWYIEVRWKSGRIQAMEGVQPEEIEKKLVSIFSVFAQGAQKYAN